MSFRPNQPRPTTQAKRYRAGHVPKDYQDNLSDSDESEQEQVQEQPKKSTAKVQFAQKEIDTGIQQTTINQQDASTDRRLRRLQQAQQTLEADDSGRRRRRVVESEEESEDEEESARERMQMKQRALQSQASVPQQVESDHEEQESDEEESSSEYESSSEEEDTLKQLPKPVFIPKARRETLLAQEKLAAEEAAREAQLEKELEERKKQSHDMLAQELKREQEEATQKSVTEYEEHVDDRDGIDEEAEFDAWRVRELGRIKRDREERIAREKEEEELERRRALPEEERLAEDLARAEASKQKERGQHTFMQKYYHKGAFYQDPNDDVLQRDYSAPTIDEVRNKDVLPKIMQVKNFGLAGRTKYTHLVDQDTSQRDSPWEKPLAKRKRDNLESDYRTGPHHAEGSSRRDDDRHSDRRERRHRSRSSSRDRHRRKRSYSPDDRRRRSRSRERRR